MAKEMHIENTIEIAKSQQEVFEFLKLVKSQNKFSVWNITDPNQKVTEKGEDGTVGYVYSWESKNKKVGTGSQEILSITPPSEISYELRFEKPMNSTAKSKFILKGLAENKTAVTWTFTGPTKFPMSLFTGFFKRMLSKNMLESLHNLKHLLEA